MLVSLAALCIVRPMNVVLYSWLAIAVVAALGAAASCKSASAPTNDAAVEGAEHADTLRDTVSVGDEVVVQDDIAVFRHGRVLQVTESGVNCEFSADRSSAQIPSSRVVRLSNDVKVPWKQGDWGVCKTSPSHWEGCAIVHVNNDTIDVLDESSARHRLAPSEIARPTEVMIATIKKRYRGDVASAMAQVPSVSASALLVPKVPPPAQYEPKPGDEVLAKRDDGQWYGGRVRRITPTKVHVVWDDKQPWSQFDYGVVLPKPSTLAQVQPGQQVLAPTKTKGKWETFRVKETQGRHVILLDDQQQERKVRLRDVLVVAQPEP